MYSLTGDSKLFTSGVESSRPRSNTVSTTLAFTLLFLFAAGMLAERLLMPTVPINVDPAAYAVASHEILNGERLYEDIWDHKPPAPFVVYAAFEAVLGFGPTTLFVMNFLATAAVMLGLFLICRRGPGGDTAGLIAAGIWALVSGSIGLEMRDPNTEALMNVCLVFAFLAMFSGERTINFKRALIAGLLLFAATMFKPVVVVVAAAFAVGHVTTSEQRTKAFRDVGIVAAVGFVGWLAAFGYFAATGRGGLFYDAVIVYNRHYAGGMIENILAPLYGNAELFVDVIGPSAVFAALLSVPLFFSDRKKWVVAVLYVCSAWVAIALPGRFSVHYYQLWLPAFIITIAWGIGSLLRSENRIIHLSGAVILVMLAAILTVTQFPDHRAVLAGEHVPVIKTLNKEPETAAFINGLLRDDETIILWGNTPNMYMATQRRPPSIFMFDSHFDPNPIRENLVALAQEKTDLSRTELLVVECNRPPVPEWIASQFEETPIFHDADGYTIFARRGGRIAGEKQ
ncbi:MAG: glycosyltransferase family 39 protein [Acidobacteria bacterium]|nr:glycosyltransferase family 39 protein [Acidobacteriota bacterium]